MVTQGPSGFPLLPKRARLQGRRTPGVESACAAPLCRSPAAGSLQLSVKDLPKELGETGSCACAHSQPIESLLPAFSRIASVCRSLFLSCFSVSPGGCTRRTTSASGIVLAGPVSCGREIGRFREHRRRRQSVLFPVRSVLKPPTGCSQSTRLG